MLSEEVLELIIYIFFWGGGYLSPAVAMAILLQFGGFKLCGCSTANTKAQIFTNFQDMFNPRGSTSDYVLENIWFPWQYIFLYL